MMSSEIIFTAMNAENWDSVRDLIAVKPFLSKEELEKKIRGIKFEEMLMIWNPIHHYEYRVYIAYSATIY